MTKKAVVAALLVLALALTACGGSGDSGSSDAGDTGSTTGSTDSGGGSASAEEYVDTLCSSLDGWLTTVMTQAESMGENTPSSPEAAKDQVVEFLSSMNEATDQMVSEIEAAGVPDVENGEAAHEALLNAFTSVQTALQEAQSAAEDLDGKDPAKMQTELMEIQTDIQNASNDVSSALNELDSPDLDQAAAESQACTDLFSTTADASASI